MAGWVGGRVVGETQPSYAVVEAGAGKNLDYSLEHYMFRFFFMNWHSSTSYEKVMNKSSRSHQKEVNSNEQVMK